MKSSFTKSSKLAVSGADPDIDLVVDLEDDEVEVVDDDFVLVEASSPPPPVSRSILRAAVAPERGREARPSLSRLALDEETEASVADECLATIAAAVSQARASDPFVAVAPSSSARLLRPRVDALFKGVAKNDELAPPASPRSIPPLGSSVPRSLSPRLPPVRPPPFVRKAAPPSAEPPPAADVLDTPVSMKGPRPAPRGEIAGARRGPDRRAESKAPFARTTTDGGAPASSGAPAVPSKNAVVGKRSRRVSWLIAAAVTAAMTTVVVTRTGGSEPSREAPPAVAASQPASPATSTVVRFDEDVAIRVSSPTSASPPSPTARPGSSPTPPVSRPAPRIVPRAQAHARAARSSRPSPKVSAPIPLPDGSLGLANSSKATSAGAPSEAPLLPQPRPRKRALTPEQELAEAQLRAAALR